ncbi:c-type cytochrome [Cupriavidus necator]
MKSFLIGATLCMAASLAHASPEDLARGKQVFQSKCAMCHTAAAGEPNGAGPNLSGVVNRPVGKHPGFGFSPALSSSKDAWSSPLLDKFLQGPEQAMPGTVMPFAGLKNEKDRKALIEFLKTTR